MMILSIYNELIAFFMRPKNVSFFNFTKGHQKQQNRFTNTVFVSIAGHGPLEANELKKKKQSSI